MGVAGRVWGVATLALLTVGCGSDDEDGPDPNLEPPSECPAPNRLVADGRCVAPGVQDSGCLAGELTLADGSCQPAGIPPEHCGEGFEPAGDGCEPILPAEPCPPGLMALPGETTCREVMPCGEGPWGDIPVEDDTVYVDQTYGGNDSDGSLARPWTTIGQGVASAAANAIVAVAPGSYHEDVWIAGTPVRLWGKCPAEVEVVGQWNDPAAVCFVQAGANGSEVHGLSIRGAHTGVGSSGSEDILVDRVWVHDTDHLGIDVETELGPTSMRLTGVLVENTGATAVLILGATVTIEDSSFRDANMSGSSDQFGRGIDVVEEELVPVATVRHTVVERCHDHGVMVCGADVEFDGLVVRDTLPDEVDQQWGRGLAIQPGLDTGRRGSAVLRRSWLVGNQEAGLAVIGSDATIESTLVRGTRPRQRDGHAGRGLIIQESIETGIPAAAEIRAVVVEQSHDVGLMVDGSSALVEGTVVRDTAPRASDQRFGRGVGIQCGSVTGARSNTTGRGLLIELNHESGLMVSGSDLQLEGSLVRDTLPGPEAPRTGYGLTVQSRPWTTIASNVTVWASVVEHSQVAGVTMVDSTILLRDVLVRDTLPHPDQQIFGDGVVVWFQSAPSQVTLERCLLADNARAGLALFGAAASLHASRLECNAIHLVQETWHDVAASLTDAGGNACGCGDSTVSCQAVSSGLAPPEPLEDLDSGG